MKQGDLYHLKTEVNRVLEDSSEAEYLDTEEALRVLRLASSILSNVREPQYPLGNRKLSDGRTKNMDTGEVCDAPCYHTIDEFPG